MKQHLIRVWNHGIAIGPRKPAWGAALRASFSIAVPLVLLALSGRLDWALYAAFGAFTAVYGRTHQPASRFIMQMSAGSSLIIAMLLGTLLSFVDSPLLIRVLVIAGVAAIVNWISLAAQWAPPGPPLRSLLSALVLRCQQLRGHFSRY